MKNVFTAAAVVAMAGLPMWAMAQTPPPTSPQPTPQAQHDAAKTQVGDAGFVKKMLEGGMAEVELGKLAVQKGASESVKQFGQRMVDDHSKAGDELKKIAEEKKITPPAAISAKDKAEQERLSKLSGEAFDRAYMRTMVADHRKDVSEVRAEATTGKDPEVKAWASKTLPTLEEHLKLAEDTNKAVGTSGKK